MEGSRYFHHYFVPPAKGSGMEINMNNLQFPLSDYEDKQLNIIEQAISDSNKKIFVLSDEQNSACFDIIEAMKQRKVISDAEINNCNAYFLIGSYAEFKKWIETENKRVPQNMSRKGMANQKEYDVFISHASKDKLDYVDKLYEVIKQLDVRVFYDTKEISWGENWKKAIINGTEQSEFAIIIISKNFFGREWTEIELEEFLKQQNVRGQKVVLPLLYNISIDEMKEKYPSLAEIQVIESSSKSNEEIAILFAKELIKRLR